MEAQLHLLTPPVLDARTRPTNWRLDDSTRSVGLRGIAAARAALQHAARSASETGDDHSPTHRHTTAA
ncbi:MAG: hypothetical protein WCK41_02730 [Actinomycetes bacterium]